MAFITLFLFVVLVRRLYTTQNPRTVLLTIVVFMFMFMYYVVAYTKTYHVMREGR